MWMKGTTKSSCSPSSIARPGNINSAKCRYVYLPGFLARNRHLKAGFGQALARTYTARHPRPSRSLPAPLGELEGDCTGPQLGHELRQAGTHRDCTESNADATDSQPRKVRYVRRRKTLKVMGLVLDNISVERIPLKLKEKKKQIRPQQFHSVHCQYYFGQ